MKWNNNNTQAWALEAGEVIDKIVEKFEQLYLITSFYKPGLSFCPNYPVLGVNKQLYNRAIQIVPKTLDINIIYKI